MYFFSPLKQNISIVTWQQSQDLKLASFLFYGQKCISVINLVAKCFAPKERKIWNNYFKIIFLQYDTWLKKKKKKLYKSFVLFADQKDLLIFFFFFCFFFFFLFITEFDSELGLQR